MFNIYCDTKTWTGHLHAVSTLESALKWGASFKERGYRKVFVIPPNGTFDDAIIV